MTLDIEAIKAAAEKATPGQWRAHITNRRKPEIYTDAPTKAETNDLVAGVILRKPDARFIALANPSAVLELIAQNAALRGALEKAAKRWDLRALVAQRSFSTVIGRADKNMYWAEKRAFEEAAGFVRSELAVLSLPPEGVKAGLDGGVE